MLTLTIDRIVFEMAFEVGDDVTQAYLDTQTGAILFVERTIPDDIASLITQATTLYNALESIDDRTNISWTAKDMFFDYARVFWDHEQRYRPIPETNQHPHIPDLSTRMALWFQAQALEAIWA